MSTSVTRAAGNEPAQSTAPASGARGLGRLRGAWPVRAALAALAGVLLYLSFPPRPLWWLAPLALALLCGCLRGRRARAGFGLGFVFGLGYLLPLLVWTSEGVGPVPWIALVTLEALIFGLTGLGIALVDTLPGRALWASALWIAA